MIHQVVHSQVQLDGSPLVSSHGPGVQAKALQKSLEEISAQCCRPVERASCLKASATGQIHGDPWRDPSGLMDQVLINSA